MDRIELVRVMNYLVLATSDEDIIEIWINYVPEQADDTDFKEIAEEDDLFEDVVNCFVRLSKHFKEGLFIEDKFFNGSFK